jgi:hypothetical protein
VSEGPTRGLAAGPGSECGLISLGSLPSKVLKPGTPTRSPCSCRLGRDGQYPIQRWRGNQCRTPGSIPTQCCAGLREFMILYCKLQQHCKSVDHVRKSL